VKSPAAADLQRQILVGAICIVDSPIQIRSFGVRQPDVEMLVTVSLRLMPVMAVDTVDIFEWKERVLRKALSLVGRKSRSQMTVLSLRWWQPNPGDEAEK